MIHGQDAVEVVVHAVAEEVVGGIGSKGIDLLLSQRLDDGIDGLLIFGTGLGIEG